MALPCFYCFRLGPISQPLTRLACGHIVHFGCMFADFNSLGVMHYCPVCFAFHPRHYSLPGTGPQENNAVDDEAAYDSYIEVTSSESGSDAAESYTDSMEWELDSSSDLDDEEEAASSGNNTTKD